MRDGGLSVDVAFLGVPSCDPWGNARGWTGKSACGSLGYALVDARRARSVVLVTDGLEPYPAIPASIGGEQVDWVVPVEAVGDPAGIGTGATRMPRDPRELLIGRLAVEAIDAAGVIREGFSFQMGSGGSSLAAIRFLAEKMRERKLTASFALGGITSQASRLLEEGLVGALLDVQSFDADAAASLARNERHYEISAEAYADPGCKGAAVQLLDVVILSALEVDEDFNVNVITGSDGVIRGASGGHSDTAAGAGLSIVVAPLLRGRTAGVVRRVDALVTPGSTVDLLVTDRGVAVNPARADLEAALRAARLPVFAIGELREMAERMTGVAEPVEHGDKVVGLVEYRDGSIIDAIRSVGA
jgi:citrate lyase subunit alpha/citrate CoA-transferase